MQGVLQLNRKFLVFIIWLDITRLKNDRFSVINLWKDKFLRISK